MLIKYITFLICLFFLANTYAQKVKTGNERVTEYVSATRVLWKAGLVKNEAQLLKNGTGQADVSNKSICILENKKDGKASILLDFGKELQGGVQIVTGIWGGNKPIKIRLRFGESASEAMSDIGGKGGATNDHAIRDLETILPWLGIAEIGNTGFRFVRIDVLEDDAKLVLKEVRAVAKYRDLVYQGSFNSSDTLLNKIWKTGAYTVQLNMQDYLWDGIKRDRLVWVGDLNPEISTINAVFGYNEVVPKSLDFAKATTPLPEWMNGISAYSMWWIINQRDWYYNNGNLKYLKEQQAYLTPLLHQLIQKIDSDNKEKLDGQRFLDWPSSEDPKAIHAGLQAMMVLALQAGSDLSTKLGDLLTAKKCADAVNRLKKYIPAHNNSKQAAALLSLAKLMDAKQANKVLNDGGSKNFSTFFGYYMLQAKANASDYQGAINIIREYWGAMLNLGATSFWEDFNMDWTKNAGRIDELVPDGKIDIHGAYGAYCYVGFRHSLCHGWASGPTPWLTEHVLGISVIEPGCKVVRIKPHLGDLKFAEGTFPTPLGLIKVKHQKLADGTVKSTISAPKGVKILR
ncbi:alpha-L-rhamnosidase C-terminal domain-containing protein [Pedobacter frigiditerrae]|uniref:alpha-L-rhamnosidase-related protein n=1 Tax=Pedobacter frigiditerrae TaxID=2530452 RepID=UPI00292E6CC1|nr:alpha-L-rhamnosidase C-terminal domain-containing protein [Pedobacter frigiditerrae]